MSDYNQITARTDANALIPEEEASEILKGMTSKSKALALMRSVRMSKKLKRMPVLSALPTAYFVNGDTGLKKTTKLAWENKYLEAEELAVIVPIPEAVLDDSDFDIWAEARPLLEEAIAIALDAAIFFGTNKPTSWAKSVAAHANDAGNEFVRGSVVGQDLAEDINKTMALVEADGFRPNGFVADLTFESPLRGLRDDNGSLLFLPSLQAGTPPTLYGKPIVYSEGDDWDTDEADLFTGDWSNGIVGIRQDLTYKLLDQAVITDDEGAIIYNLAQQDMVAMRVVARFGWQIANPVRRKNTSNSTRSPFAVLRPIGYT
jgi:HK97 family phage major capsid protein